MSAVGKEEIAPVLELSRRDTVSEAPAFLARLAALHDEAQDTARLANLLGRSLHAAIALPAMGVAAILATGNFAASTASWAFLVVIASLAVGRAYATAIHAPFERPVLQTFELDLNAVLLYSGFAWGAGAFLIALAGTGNMAAFAVLPCLVFAVLLRARDPVLLFVAPVTALGLFACVFRSDAAIDATLILVGCGAAATIAVVADRHAAAPSAPRTTAAS